MNKTKLIFKSIFLTALLIFLPLTSCQNEPIINKALNNQNNTSIDHVFGKNRSKKGGTINTEINLNKFSTKDFQAREKLSNVKSIRVYLTTNQGSPTPNVLDAESNPVNYTIDINQLNSRIVIQFRNIIIGSNYYLAVEAYDNTGGTGNNITLNGTSVSNNSATVAGDLSLTYDSDDNLSVDLKLINNQAENGAFNLHQFASGQILDIDSCIDNYGNGYIAASNDNSEIVIQKLIEFIPSGSPQVRDIGSPATANSIAVDCISTNKQSPNDIEGLLVYSDFLSGNSQVKLLKLHDFTGSIDLISNPISASTNLYPDIEIKSNGDGVIVWQSANELIIRGQQIYNYNQSPVTQGIGKMFYKNTNVKERPKLSLNDNGDGVLVWQEDMDPSGNTDYDIYGIPIINFDTQETIKSTTFLSISGNTITVGGGVHDKEFQTGSRIVLIDGSGTIEERVVNNILTTPDRLELDISPSLTSPLVIIGGKSSSYIANDGGLLTNPVAPANPLSGGDDINLAIGQRVNLFNSLDVKQEVHVSTINSSSSIDTTPVTSICTVLVTPCNAFADGSFRINHDDLNRDQMYPNVVVDHSGNGLVVWKSDISVATDRIYGVRIERKSSFPLTGIYDTGSGSPFVKSQFKTGDSSQQLFSDQSEPGLSLDGNGNGLINWTQLSTNRIINTRKITDYVAGSAAIGFGATGQDINTPLVNVDPTGNGMVFFKVGSQSLSTRHVLNYIHN